MKLNIPTLLLLALPTALSQGLNITAIAAVNGASVLQCWHLAAAPADFASAVNYPLGAGAFSGSFLGVIAPRTVVGKAWAPHVQFSFVLSGLVHISIPDSKQEAWIQGGRYGGIIAADTKDVSLTGHITEFPGGDETLIAQFPMVGNEVPAHEVLYDGACGVGKLIGGKGGA
ncbi:hypothetical protein EJ06DRAFT_529199 [Trichodelitschia bisporula]|uniref:Small secreted protein n=1 Tax=Trichodelitschia bisporula TaxID=703511 RepID=A0A6G1I1C4_9PEZI|nr:hypothetical protein EJ06DRAFT_529199 [Trichodelitschia bisporula]